MKITNHFILEPLLTYESADKQYFEQVLIKTPKGYPIAMVHVDDFFWNQERKEYLVESMYNSGKIIKAKITIEVEE